ncbi:P35 lipoprotein homolog reported as IMP14 [Malacoplasma penetrans HF-2]|uniref:P35 lipoprotein homolog reported as IMP14 n=1 Tax=Malacoplasma penetrans (strain HF-2) TaxID=272633 RepID=Q8EV86_MALP2|nr:P35 family lipoprotein [Malacoplasma penetrans]BAC44474.1 P35 lipoprotein homolog reported as IMP14 [Malacoplasma penetrans HF-2]
MKIKKIKLLKALALTGAFGIVATVPVIVSSCSSTSDNNGNGNNNNDNNGGGSGTDQQQGTTYTPAIKTEVSLSGSLSKIYDTTTGDSRKNTNEMIAQDILSNPEDYFTNGADLKNVQGWSVTVDGNFDSQSTWTGEAYSAWSANATFSGVYAIASEQLNITSLNDLKTQLSDSTKLKAICDAIPGLRFSSATASSYQVQNQVGFTGDDLLHINVTAQDGNNTRNMNLGIPVSDLNLKITGLKVSVNGTNNETGNNVESVENLTTDFTYNIGIKDTVDFTQPTTTPTTTEANKNNVNEALKALGYTKTDGSLDNDKIAAAVGIYNCTFVASSIQEDSNTPNKFTITLKATPNENYVWEDGTREAKDVSFDVTFTVN